MRKKRMEAVATVKKAYITTERAAEQTALDALGCAMTMIEARKASNVAVATGVDELIAVTEGALHAVRAHVCFAKAHAGLRAIPAAIGVPMAAGPDDTYPNEPARVFFMQDAEKRTA